jgi:hypothetical protein
MEVLRCRFRTDQVILEVLFAVAVAFMGSVPLYLSSPPGEALFLIPGTALAALLVIATLCRWRSRIVLDDRGVEYRRSPRQVVTRLTWEEIDEFFLTGGATFELRGAGRRIAFNGFYDEILSARDLCLPRLSCMRDLLRSRALQEGALRFRMPDGRLKAHLAYLAVVLILSGVTWYILTMLLGHGFNAFPFVLLFFGGGWLWRLRRRASRMGTRVTLHRRGLLVRRLDGKDRVAWDALQRTEWNPHGGLDLVLRSGRVISLPPALANIGLLEEFIREGRRAVDFETQREGEGRTILQSSEWRLVR